MKIWKNIITGVALSGILAACQDLDIPPKNILSGSDIYNEGGITAYMAGLYNHLPMEDFNMGDDGGRGGFFNWNSEKTTLGSTGEFANNQCGNNVIYGDKGYWKDGYQIIRQANVLIQDLPNYVGTLQGAESWIAEAKFVRAYTYFALVKRYGGVPLLEEPQGIDDDLIMPRSSHQDCVDFILKDLDDAINGMTKTKTNGRANKYVAAAFKSRVALYAGSIARYGEAAVYTGESGTMLTGIPASLANDYFRQAYDAAKIVEEGGYALHKGSDKRQAFYEVFDKAASSEESIFIREYDINNYVHSWDKLMSPEAWTGGYGGRYFVPLDWVELFDGLPLDPATGYLKTTDDEGYYKVYDSSHGIFDGAEPRLLASIMIPGDLYKGGHELDMRCGLLVNDVTPDQKILKTTKDDGKTTYSWDNGVKEFKVNGQVVAVRSTKKPSEGQTYENTGIAIAGFNGPSTSGGNHCNTGIYGVKWIQRDQAPVDLHRSTQPWIDIRYAEVLLNRAEAAIELAQNGASDAGTLLNDAMVCINDVRDRAGADLLTSTDQLADLTTPTNVRGTGKNSMVFAPTKGLQIVRVERYKELAVEHKLYWDLRRWFTADTQIKEFRWRMLAPYLFLSTAVKDDETGIPHGKYIFDTRVCDSYGGQHNFDSKYYYEKIPDSERKVNYLLEQNNRY
mgnify:CR=1 FL=1